MLHPRVKEFKEFMEERPDLRRMVRKRSVTLQELFEEWHLSGTVTFKEEEDSRNKSETNFQSADWTVKLAKVLSLFEGMKWSNILSDVQGMLEMAQIYLADLAEQQKEKK
ncbi:spore coat protein YlbD [Pseudobacillus sp. FSL P4-0506]|uniref:spore coat protein YlbD n=1 Tax=unclassified Pseudobacillus TaxID=2619284 RepID=UPI0030FB4620